jgi:hypothetical protein
MEGIQKSTAMFHFEHEGRTVLGFDTGLSERSFAQAKAASLLTESGYVVSPDGSFKTWKSEGVIELNKTMIIWGPDFEGMSLDTYIQNEIDKDAALHAPCSWLYGIQLLSQKDIFPNPSPKGVLIANDGSVLFLPSGLVKRVLDIEGENAKSFSQECYMYYAGIMLYHLFSGEAAFPHSDQNRVRNAIQQGDFIPLNLAAPGLDTITAETINSILQRKNTNSTLIDLINLFGPKGSRQYKDFFDPISDDEKKSLISKREQFQKRSQTKLKTRMFFRRYKTAIIGSGIGFVIAIIVAWNIITGINKGPNTKEMTPYEIAQQYYASFGTLNHEFMEAATIKNAGKSDIDMVQNLFVISKIRQAYEMISPVVPAQTWIEEGSPETESMVFGITNLELTEISQSTDEASFKISGLLWMPPESDDDANALMHPVSIQYKGEIMLIKKNDAWYISEITKHQD